ncbi:MAG: radical SAM protein [Saprospiraceae bacterium]|nr:radical SAM protein [Saprospiraceae bacterium]
MYFNSLGHIAPCWLTFQDPEIYTPDKSILEIWRSEKFTNLRTAIKNHHLSYRCNTCLENLQNGNYTNILSKAYDNNYPLSDYPTIMEFELTNTYNLECVMCTGMLSSSIRKTRDQLPPLPNPYGDKFVEDLKQMIPHLHEARFNGGEPFLIKLYYPIWDHIIAINPKVKIVIATNGTVINDRVRHYIQKGNIHLNISIDGLAEQTYNAIRINGKIEQVLGHFEEFRQLCARFHRTICVMINPMRSNWWEMPDFVNFCNQNHVHLWFNTIERPLDHALWNLPAIELQKYTTNSTTLALPTVTTPPSGFSTTM